jgi:hypothetical protein
MRGSVFVVSRIRMSSKATIGLPAAPDWIGLVESFLQTRMSMEQMRLPAEHLFIGERNLPERPSTVNTPVEDVFIVFNPHVSWGDFVSVELGIRR